MILKDSNKRSLQGFLYSGFIESKVLYSIFSWILAGYFALMFLIDIIFVFSKSTGSSNNNGGALNMGFITALICMFISAIISASRSSIKSSFVFPIDRKTYTIGTYIMFIVDSVVLLLIASVAYIIEYVAFSILSRLSEKFFYSSFVTLESYLVGLWVSLCYIVFVAALTYLIFIVFRRFKLTAVVIFGVGVGLSFMFETGRMVLLQSLMFFIGEQSILILSCKLLVLSIVFQIVSFLPMRNLEVNP